MHRSCFFWWTTEHTVARYGWKKKPYGWHALCWLEECLEFGQQVKGGSKWFLIMAIVVMNIRIQIIRKFGKPVAVLCGLHGLSWLCSYLSWRPISPIAPGSQLMTTNNDDEDDHMFAGSFDLETIWWSYLWGVGCDPRRALGWLHPDHLSWVFQPPLIKTNWTAGSGQTIRPAPSQHRRRKLRIWKWKVKSKKKSLG